MGKDKGITLVALVITIIVMLILVGVVIAVNLDDGPINKANDAKTKTEITEIEKEIFRVKENIIAKNDGEEPDEYDISWDDLNISDDLRTKYQDKLSIGSDGKLYASDEFYNENKTILNDIGIDTYKWFNTSSSEIKQMKKYDNNDEYEPVSYNIIAATDSGDPAVQSNDSGIYVALVKANYEDGNHFKNVQGIIINKNGHIYLFFTKDNVRIEGQSFNRDIWYNISQGTVQTTCPISIEDFSDDEIYCRSFLERVINSFGEE